ncbi:hypothetical protein BD410DRAFT_787562 [Rickenella mellea]|uniref:AN1-type domain-containing protein n=1 Tax=Rickenella mellea TaxID=50990 RepID=A0A4Y7Q8S9_9AGAM|nr:hypothetical protein BD410DRAFT_787562 [Rickenella mellea]
MANPYAHVTYAKPREERAEPLLHIGKQCSSTKCTLVDFLPLKCEHCKEDFCGDHFKPDAHECKEWDPSKHDRVAPPCPLCSTPVAIPPNEDPNLRMERHINSECVAMGNTGKAPTVTKCGNKKCTKMWFMPIQCEKCRKQFCPEHRDSARHHCVTTTINEAPSSSNLGKTAVQQTSAASAAAAAAIRRQMASMTSKPKPKPQPTPAAKPVRAVASSSKANTTSGSGSGSGSKTPNPFNKQDSTSLSSHNLRSSPKSPLSTLPPTSTTASNLDDDATKPPERCSPKLTPQSDPWSFVPRPLFGTA